MSDLHGKFIWYELMTTDPEAAGAFYEAVIGWTKRDSGMAPEGSYYLFEMPGSQPLAGGMQRLLPELAAEGVPPNWTGFVAVDDVDAAAEKCASLGGTIRRPPQDIPDVGRFAVLADPQGAVFIVMAPKPMDEPGPQMDMTAPGFTGWHELNAADRYKALDFYSALFGWEKIDEMDMGPGGSYLLFGRDGMMMGGIMNAEPDMPCHGWAFYFNVDALDEAAERVNDGGGRIVNGPMQVPDGWVLQALDPQGAYFCLNAPKR